jgi:hypothetical protein
MGGGINDKNTYEITPHGTELDGGGRRWTVVGSNLQSIAYFCIKQDVELSLLWTDASQFIYILMCEYYRHEVCWMGVNPRV